MSLSHISTLDLSEGMETLGCSNELKTVCYIFPIINTQNLRDALQKMRHWTIAHIGVYVERVKRVVGTSNNGLMRDVIARNGIRNGKDKWGRRDHAVKRQSWWLYLRGVGNLLRSLLKMCLLTKFISLHRRWTRVASEILMDNKVSNSDP